METADTGTAADRDTAAPAGTPSPIAAAPILLGRDDILGAVDFKFEDVPVDEWKPGAVVRVQSLSSGARAELEDFLAVRRASATPDSNDSIREMFAAICIVDEQGQRLFTPADIAKLKQKNARPIERIFAAAQRLNDVSDAAVAREAGNSEREGSDTSQ